MYISIYISWFAANGIFVLLTSGQAKFFSSNSGCKHVFIIYMEEILSMTHPMAYI